MQEMQFDFDGLIQLLAGHLYSEKQVFLRELLQNAQDSITRRHAIDPHAPVGRIDLYADPQNLLLEIRDNGIGMTDADLNHFLSTIGNSGTRLQKQDVSGLVGQFGIGFLAAFLVARRVEVHTKRFDSAQGWAWVNEGQKHYELTPFSVEQSGTTVRVFLKGPEERGLLYEDELRVLITQYADMLPAPIYLNGWDEPVNLRRMPWEHVHLSEEERRETCLRYLEEKMPDGILEVIPFALSGEVAAQGVLYLTKTRTVGIDIPRRVRLYLHRMFLSENVPDILPSWATFINGIINAEGLSPTAARDAYVRNAAADRLREALGEVIIRHLIHLHQNNPERFRAIQRYHALGVKSACFYHKELFAKLAPLLLWRTNGTPADRRSGLSTLWKTLPDILACLPTQDGHPPALPCFTDSHAAHQYFRMANAADTLVVDASYLFEEELLKAYADLPTIDVRLVHIDRGDALSLFQPLKGQEGLPIKRLAETLANCLPTKGARLRVEVRHFNPPDLPAVLRTGERSRAAHQASSLLSDPNVHAEVQEMARELLEMSRGATTQLILNASNPFLQRLAQQDLSQPRMEVLLQGLYHAALIHNAECLTPEMTQALQAYLEQLLQETLHMVVGQQEVLLRERALLHARAAARPTTSSRSHGKALLITSSETQQGVWVSTLRQLVEDQWGCELLTYTNALLTASSAQSLLPLLGQADLVFLDGQSPVAALWYAMGLVQGQSPSCPIVLLVPSHGMGHAEPMTLEGFSGVMPAPNGADDASITHWQQQLMQYPSVHCFFQDPDRPRFLSPQRLAQITQLALPDSIFRALADAYPTLAHWAAVTPEHLPTLLHDYAGLAESLLERIRTAADAEAFCGSTR